MNVKLFAALCQFFTFLIVCLANNTTVLHRKERHIYLKRYHRQRTHGIGLGLGPLRINIGIPNKPELPTPYTDNEKYREEPPPYQQPYPDSEKPYPTQPSYSDLSPSQTNAILKLKEEWDATRQLKAGSGVNDYQFYFSPGASKNKYQRCFTPYREPGRCHYIQHCPMSNVIYSYEQFLSYACFIRDDYVGVCCPDEWSRETDETYTLSKLTTTTTTTKRPPIHRTPKPPTHPPTHPPTPKPTPKVMPPPTPKPTLPPPPAKSQLPNTDFSSFNPHADICGVSNNPMSRIIGGRDAEPESWVWMAALLRAQNPVPDQYCGGALVTDRFIITAAHCVRGQKETDITVRLGAYEFENEEKKTAHDYKVERIFMHPNYNKTSQQNDIAILKLARKVPFNDDIHPICFPSENNKFIGKMATVVGWGATEYGGPSAKRLQEVTMPIWKNEECITAYNNRIKSTNICAADRNGGKDSCQGDSGGPLMYFNKEKERYILVGVVSWGIRCGDRGFPGVYTRITEFMDWIKMTVKN